jgi:hypothetical protein
VPANLYADRQPSEIFMKIGRRIDVKEIVNSGSVNSYFFFEGILWTDIRSWYILVLNRLSNRPFGLKYLEPSPREWAFSFLRQELRRRNVIGNASQY